MNNTWYTNYLGYLLKTMRNRWTTKELFLCFLWHPNLIHSLLIPLTIILLEKRQRNINSYFNWESLKIIKVHIYNQVNIRCNLTKQVAFSCFKSTWSFCNDQHYSKITFQIMNLNSQINYKRDWWHDILQITLNFIFIRT